MNENKYYTLPDLKYPKNALEPYMSAEVLTLHHDKHHKAYVDKANATLEKIDEARKSDEMTDQKSLLKDLSFNVGGHILHSVFWEIMGPKDKTPDRPSGELAKAIDDEFGSFERFKEEFTAASLSVEGSGWGALAYCKKTKRPILMQIEKHNTNIYPMFKILLPLDVWEHAYYLDYKNDRGAFIKNFFEIIDWEAVAKRFEEVQK